MGLSQARSLEAPPPSPRPFSTVAAPTRKARCRYAAYHLILPPPRYPQRQILESGAALQPLQPQRGGVSFSDKLEVPPPARQTLHHATTAASLCAATEFLAFGKPFEHAEGAKSDEGER